MENSSHGINGLHSNSIRIILTNRLNLENVFLLSAGFIDSFRLIETYGLLFILT